MSATRGRRGRGLSAFIATVALCASSCGGGAQSSGGGGSPSPGAQPGQTPKWTGTASADELGDLAIAVTGNSAFALDLYQQLRGANDDNLFFSPASISTALAMTFAGARAETEAEMARTMHFDLEQARLHASFRQLTARLEKQPEKSELAIANRLWSEKSWRFVDEFLATTRDFYGAELETLDFKGDQEGSRQTINAWVEDKTKDRIRELLKPGNVKPDTRLILTNAVYFKAPWQVPFEEGSTTDQPFWLSSDEQRAVPMMRQVGYAGYGESGGVKVLEKGYKGGTLSMVVLLPDNKTGLADLEQRLDATTLDSLLASTQPQKVRIWLPKFKFERRAELADTLKAMGMKLAFSDAADFSGMTGARDLKIDDVIHQAFIAVYEEGTEAAAATAVIMAEITSAGPRPEPKEFKADHPFIFLIRDRATGTILFMGRLTTPEG